MIPYEKHEITILDGGFRKIALPKDIGDTTITGNILVIGLGPFFSPEVVQLLENKTTQFHILYTTNIDILRSRSKAIQYDQATYTKLVKNQSSTFINQYSKKNNEFRHYERYPFGLYLKIGKYSWFTPLWNTNYKHDEGTSIDQKTIQVKSSTYLGAMLEYNFQNIWNSTSVYKSQ